MSKANQTLDAIWSWLLQWADTAREMVTEAAPAALKPLVADLPDEAVLAIAAALLIGLAFAAWKSARGLWLWVFARKRYEEEQPAQQGDVQRLKEQVDSQSDLLKRVLARLEGLQTQNVEAGAAPLGTRERDRQREAAAEVVADGAPAAQAAARDLAAGEIAAAIAILERDARADVSAAADKWRRLGALVMGVDTAKARTAYEEAFKLQPDDFWTCVELSRLRQESGDLGGARTAAECAVGAATNMRDQMVAANTLGDVMREGGDLAGAKARYEEGLKLSEQLAQDNRGSAEAQRDLLVSYERLGIVAKELGDLPAALQWFEKERVLSQARMDNDGSAEAKRFHSVVLNLLGDVLRESGDLAGAKARYEEDLKISEPLARANPNSAQAQRDLSVSYGKLGDVLRAAGDLSGAKARHEESLKISEPLARANPGSARAQRDLSINYERLGDIAEQMGDVQTAIDYYQRSLPIAQSLAVNNPSNPRLAKDAKITEARLAELKAKAA
jgi:tetratricopeptide (TPR) repeat protein